ncbi:archaeosortase/exosortase family protein [Haloferula sargassicola]
MAGSGCPAIRWKAVAAVAALLLASLPTLAWYGRRLDDGSDEPLGLIALLAGLGTLGAAVRFGGRDRDQVRIAAGRMLAGAAGLAVVQAAGWPRYPLLTGLLTVAVIGFSLRMPRGKAGVMALLVLSLPLVASLDFYAGYPLRLAAAEITRWLLKLGGLPVERAGVVILEGERMVGIDPPCAGIRMLWTACFVAAVLAARLRLSAVRTLALLTMAVGCVIIGNGLRAAIVFFPESGRVAWPHWLHPGTGLLVHGGVLLAVFHLSGRLARLRRPRGSLLRRGMVVGFGLLAVVAGRTAERPGPIETQGIDEKWPAVWEGVPLVRLPLSKVEERFAAAFPGSIARFRCGDAELILRRTDRATRRMHPAADCLRAEGFTTHSEPAHRDADGRLWGTTRAGRDGRSWTVRERYVSAGGKACTDASAWFWNATLHPEAGPWTAVTMIRPAETP